MKITRIEAIHLRLPEVNERCDGSQETLVVKVHTDAGLVGVGEVDSSSVVAKAIIDAPLSHKICRGLAACVVGESPFEIDRLIHRMYEGTIFFGRQGAVIRALSGVEIALWDLVGKAAGRPVYQLLGGGFRKAFRAYASILFGDTPAETERTAWALAAQANRCHILFVATQDGPGKVVPEKSRIRDITEACGVTEKLSSPLTSRRGPACPRGARPR